MTPEEERAKAAANKRAYRLRKKAEALDLQAPKEELTALFNEEAKQAIIITDKSNLHDVERAFSHKENAQAIVEAAEERHRRVELIMANYQKDASNMNKLLWHILETLTLMRIELTDLIGGIHR